MKEFQKGHTTPEQSKRLLDLGVPADSANYRYIAFRLKGCDFDTPRLNYMLYTKHASFERKTFKYYPCWSALRLMEIIDICALGENSDPNTEEYPSTIKVMNKLHIPYVEYLVKSIERAVQLGTIDFSKLDIQ